MPPVVRVILYLFILAMIGAVVYAGTKNHWADIVLLVGGAFIITIGTYIGFEVRSMVRYQRHMERMKHVWAEQEEEWLGGRAGRGPFAAETPGLPVARIRPVP